MKKVEGEYSFDGLHVGPKVKLPTRAELIAMLGNNPTAEEIRNVSYTLLREEIARQTGMTVAKVTFNLITFKLSLQKLNNFSESIICKDAVKVSRRLLTDIT